MEHEPYDDREECDGCGQLAHDWSYYGAIRRILCGLCADEEYGDGTHENSEDDEDEDP